MAASSSTNEIIRLWPDGPPSPIEGVPPETTFLPPYGVAAGTTMVRNISDPTLTVFRPDNGKANGVGIVIAPGGGWIANAWTHEGVDVARWLNAHGYTAFVLKYRLQATSPDPEAFRAVLTQIDARRAEPPLRAAEAPRRLGNAMNAETRRARDASAEDGRRAIEIVRERARHYDLRADAIGMIGFSAGAFLTVDIAVDPRGAQPAFVAPIYGGETDGRPVPADAPPLFTLVAQDDRRLLKIVEGLYTDWSNADRPAEFHVFTRGGHGFGMVRQELPVDRWSELLLDWLRERGFR